MVDENWRKRLVDCIERLDRIDPDWKILLGGVSVAEDEKGWYRATPVGEGREVL